MGMRVTMALLAALALSGAAHAQQSRVAQQSRFYAGASLGKSSAKLGNCASAVAGVQACDIEDSDTAWKLFGGYRFAKDLAIEASYVDLGKFRMTAWGPFETASSVYKVTGLAVDGVKTWPFGAKLGLWTRVGVFVWTLDVSSSSSGLGGFVGSSEKTTKASADIGLGLKYDFHKDIAALIEFQRYFGIGTSSTGTSDIDLLSASFIYTFR